MARCIQVILYFIQILRLFLLSEPFTRKISALFMRSIWKTKRHMVPKDSLNQRKLEKTSFVFPVFHGYPTPVFIFIFQKETIICCLFLLLENSRKKDLFFPSPFLFRFITQPATDSMQHALYMSCKHGRTLFNLCDQKRRAVSGKQLFLPSKNFFLALP